MAGGVLTRDQLVTEICDVVGKSGSGSAVSGNSLTSRVQIYLNNAQRRLARYWNWQELITRTEVDITEQNNKLELTGVKFFDHNRKIFYSRRAP